jgi:replicative DNA helicase
MIVKPLTDLQYLKDFHAGKIKKGLGIGNILDDYIRFKKAQFVMINGLPNVGKTRFLLWYFLALSVKHNLKWCIWSGENQSGQLKRDLIQNVFRAKF